MTNTTLIMTQRTCVFPRLEMVNSTFIVAPCCGQHCCIHETPLLRKPNPSSHKSSQLWSRWSNPCSCTSLTNNVNNGRWICKKRQMIGFRSVRLRCIGFVRITTINLSLQNRSRVPHVEKQPMSLHRGTLVSYIKRESTHRQMDNGIWWTSNSRCDQCDSHCDSKERAFVCAFSRFRVVNSTFTIVHGGCGDHTLLYT